MTDVGSAMERCLSLSDAGASGRAAEFRVGLESAPYLADHAVQSMVILPGSCYVDVARRLERESTNGSQGRICDVTFHRPITLTAEDTVVRVRVRNDGAGRATYTFHEAGGDDGAASPAASLVVDRTATSEAGGSLDRPAIEAFRQSAAAMTRDRFYDQLRANGNQYGPRFRRVESVWRSNHQAVGRLDVPPDAEVEVVGPHAIVLDAMTQVLASCLMHRGMTFILQSIDTVDIRTSVLPATLWARAELRERHADDDRFVGDVRAFDEAGTACLELSGVTFTCVEPPQDGETGAGRAMRFVVAANFTADPIEDPLVFWGDQFGVPTSAAFAPYNQVFQQLLDPGSPLRTNRDGVNVVLLRLEEWTGREAAPPVSVDHERVDRCLGDRRRCTLPNGLEIVHLNAYETDYLYKEIFQDQVYLRHGIRLPDGATVLDIGANIGMFSLYVLSRCKDPTIYAFEPAPVAYELLQANCQAYGSAARALNVGVGATSGWAPFTFYEQSSVFSGFHADETEDREAIRAVVRNTLSSATTADRETVEHQVEALTADRLRGTTHECRMTTVSDVIREHGIDRIDLLKIDAEKSEWEVLAGIAEQDWPRIAQVVMEIHDRTGDTVREVEALLGAKGFRCVVEHERLLEDSGLYTLYATRSATAVDAGAGVADRPGTVLERNIDDLCAALQEGTRRGSTPLILCVCPRSPAARADPDLAAALDAAEQRLRADVSAMPSVHLIDSVMLDARYPVEDGYDPHGHHLGHVPYTSDGFSAIGAAVFRTVARLRGRRFKVIVLDCDHTLWEGVCGEDGPMGLDMSGPYRDVQRFMVDQMHAGMLLCLCSKNNEQDVLNVFDQRRDMVLERGHLVSWRINWRSKPENLRSLAQELDLGLDSFIFVDDNPVECAEVRFHCPEVLTLQLPAERASLPAFLNHTWAFDHGTATGEDRHRTRMYREHTRRREFRAEVRSLKAFIEGLDLRVDVQDLAAEHLERASQLTFRTNQFNLTTIRRTEQEIKQFLRQPGAAGHVVRVADRFGDYGLVGLVLYASLADRYRVDTLLLSCRVLGRGVEHAVLSHLGRRAVAEGRGLVELAFRPTQRNAPARAFLERLDAAGTGDATTSWLLPADRVASLAYEPEDAAAPAPDGTPAARPARNAAPGFGTRDPSDVLPHIAEHLSDVERITAAVEQHRARDEPAGDGAGVAPRGSEEAALLATWRKVLGRPRIGVDDNFFEVGGTSLKAVLVLALIKRDLKRDLSIVTLFECPTVALLAARLRSRAVNAQAAGAPQAAERGRRRRKVVRRGVS